MRKMIYAAALAMLSMAATAQNTANPNASPEAKALLERIRSLSGHTCLAGQHNYPLMSDTYTERARNLTNKYPVVMGQDFGYSEPNSLDGINFRQRTIDNAIKWHGKGAIITLMWHAVPPTTRDNFTIWKGENGIQSRLSEKQWADLFADGTEINSTWKSQVDVVAFYLKQLQDMNIPVIFRPYHEMNGDWFWWGYSEENYKKLYRMLFERITSYHKINNLLWVFNANELGSSNVKEYDGFYPGHDCVDILATDFYSGNYEKGDYEKLLKISGGKPIAIGECGILPSPQILEKQSKWSWFMCWSEFLETANQDWDARFYLYNSSIVTTLDEYTGKKQ